MTKPKKGKRLDTRRKMRCEAHHEEAETKIWLTFGTCGREDCLPASLVAIWPSIRAYVIRAERERGKR